MFAPPTTKNFDASIYLNSHYGGGVFSANIWFLLLLSILPKFTVETRRDQITRIVTRRLHAEEKEVLQSDLCKGDEDSHNVHIYWACKQSHLSRNHGAKTVLCLGDSFPFHLHSIHLSKFTRIYPFFFPLSTFPKFTRNFGGSTAREEGALPSRQKCQASLSPGWTRAVISWPRHATTSDSCPQKSRV